MIASLAILALAQMTAPGLEPSVQQVLHLCVTPNDPIEDQQALTHYGLSIRDEYGRYFNDLNAYLLCLQQSQADIIQQGWQGADSSAFSGGENFVKTVGLIPAAKVGLPFLSQRSASDGPQPNLCPAF